MFNGRRTMIAAAASLLLAACNGTSGTALTEQQIQDIKNATTLACSFVPTAINIAAAVPAAAPYTVPASVIAKAICDAVTKQGATVSADQSLTTTIDVDGNKTVVTVSGYFVPKIDK